MTHEVGQHSGTRRFVALPTLALALMVAALALVAYFPFAWDPPHNVRNDVTRTTEGNLRFGERNAAQTSGSPQWLFAAQKSGRLTIDVEARPHFPQRHSPASIMLLARDYWHTSFAIGQDHTDLVLWVRRPGSTDNGNPPFAVPDVFRPKQWTSVRVQIVGDRLALIVDGQLRLHESLPPGTLSTWRSGRIALGGEVHGGIDWQGEIRRAEVTTVGDSIDYAQSGLVVPSSYFYFPDHITPFPPPVASEWVILVLHLLSFILVGLLLVWTSRPPISVLPATIMAFGLAVVLALGKFFFDGRHTSAGDLVMQLLGGLIGALLGHWWLRQAEKRASASPDDPDSLTTTSA
jgi:VanZ family protein